MGKYIGITIGPIYKTLQNARSTGELWGGSYIFSYIIKNIIKKIREKKIAIKPEDLFVVPYVNDNLLKETFGVGMFNDRLIFKSTEDDDFETLQIIINEVLESLAKDICKTLDEKDEDKVISYVKEYFQIYCVEKDIKDDIECENNKFNPILIINKYLDVMELNKKFVSKERKNYIYEYLKNENIKKSILKKDAFSEDSFTNGVIFPSTIRIGVQGLGFCNCTLLEAEEKDSKYFYEVLEEKEPEKYKKIKKHNKYIVIVHADGDNMGQIIGGLNNQEQYSNFSKKLLEFDQEAHDIIEKNYGGKTIFAGGDDLLFFAPIINNKNKNIFNLIDELSQKFENIFENEIKDIKNYNKYVPEKDKKNIPSLSFGISITYNKYPLYEALQQSRDLLSKAKNHIEGKNRKNAISFKIIKHSGQAFGITINKDSIHYKKFKYILKNVICKDTLDEKIFKSVRYTLSKNFTIINKIANNQKRLEYFFENTFNEDIHEQYKDYLNYIKELIFELYKNNCDFCKNSFSEFNNTLDVYLRFINFLQEKE